MQTRAVLSEYSLARLHGCFTCRGKEASDTQLQSSPFENVTVQTGKQHRMNSFIVVGVFYWIVVVWDIHEWYLLFHGRAVLRGMGTFWKRSVSRVLLGILLVFGFWLVGFCCFVFLLLSGDTQVVVSLIFSKWEQTILTKGLMTVRASSAHRTGKKR